MKRSIVVVLAVLVGRMAFGLGPEDIARELNSDFHRQASLAPATIVCPNKWGTAEALAAREIRRYVYRRNGALLPVSTSFGANDAIVVVQKGDPFLKREGVADRSWESLGPQDYVIKALPRGTARAVYIVGGSGVATLYGAYRFAEHLGVRFYLQGDVIPDTRTGFALPDLDERRSPLFPLRGIQPFHDFPEGPDWWNTDDYKAIIAQLPKLGMNFFGLHTYPVVEPTVWIGQSQDIQPDGRVAFSYPTRYFNTALTVGWGFNAKKTSDYACGAGALYDRDDYGSDIMRGLTPLPATPEQSNEVFDRTGAMLDDAFSFARALGVKTCIGTETPLVVPDPVRQRAGATADTTSYYEGIFRRIARAHPLDYYWFWTPEGWTWEGVKEEQVKATVDDLLAAQAGLERSGAPFQLATCGWVLGPQFDRAYLDKAIPKSFAVSCINRAVGWDPVEPGFAEVSGREKWAIPWLEDDPAMTSMQLWAGRMRRDAKDALDYGCTGLMGIHWRTRVLEPNIGALAQAAWSQQGWPERAQQGSGVTGGTVTDFPGVDIADTEDDALYSSVRYDMTAYRIVVPNGLYRVTLKFCDPFYTEAGKRVFGVKLEGKPVIEHLDLVAKVGTRRALDFAFDAVNVEDGVLDIDFAKGIEFPVISAIAVEGNGVTTRIDCGGQGYADYAADLGPLAPHVPADDFYADWALAEFGPDVAPDAARIFAKVDGQMPRPSIWIGGPGGYAPNKKPWEEVGKDYAFVDEFAALRPRVSGPGNLERYDYWLNNMQFLRGMGRTCCIWGRYDEAAAKAKAEADPAARAKVARESVLPLRIDLMRSVEDAYDHLLATVNTAGEMGTVCNLEQHTFPTMIDATAKELADWLGEPLPDEAQLRRTYAGPPRLFVPTLRGSVRPGESLTVRAVVLDTAPAQRAVLHWRPLGTGDYREIAMDNVGRSTYAATIPPDAIADDIEYWVEATASGGGTLRCPATAPDINQTVVRADLAQR